MESNKTHSKVSQMLKEIPNNKYEKKLLIHYLWKQHSVYWKSWPFSDLYVVDLRLIIESKDISLRSVSQFKTAFKNTYFQEKELKLLENEKFEKMFYYISYGEKIHNKNFLEWVNFSTATDINELKKYLNFLTDQSTKIIEVSIGDLEEDENKTFSYLNDFNDLDLVKRYFDNWYNAQHYRHRYMWKKLKKTDPITNFHNAINEMLTFDKKRNFEPNLKNIKSHFIFFNKIDKFDDKLSNLKQFISDEEQMKYVKNYLINNYYTDKLQTAIIQDTEEPIQDKELLTKLALSHRERITDKNKMIVINKVLKHE